MKVRDFTPKKRNKVYFFRGSLKRFGVDHHCDKKRELR